MSQASRSRQKHRSSQYFKERRKESAVAKCVLFPPHTSRSDRLGWDAVPIVYSIEQKETHSVQE